MSELSHIDSSGQARMVDVSVKADSLRIASASGAIHMSPATFLVVEAASLPKGDVVAVARLAGIQAAKQTASLIPLCHPLPLRDVQVDVVLDAGLPGVRVSATARTVGPTGVEMEAMTAVAVALLTVYDMAKAVQKDMVMSEIRLDSKEGGRSGPWRRPSTGER
jgi:cyclic pyranopterin monophosphate synthase